MDIDFDAVVKALKDINYGGYFTLEADNYLAAWKEDPEKGIGNLAAAARRLADMFEVM